MILMIFVGDAGVMASFKRAVIHINLFDHKNPGNLRSI